MRRTFVAILLVLVSPAALSADPFRDCADCPEMVIVPAGTFIMGSPAAVTEREGVPAKRARREQPPHRVTIGNSYAFGRTEVTRAQYAAFVAATGRAGGPGCKYWTGTAFETDAAKGWRDPGYAQADDHPATCISWDDATAYVAWLSTKTGRAYRLPSEAEWEYAARAGSEAARFWGDDPAAACSQANVYDRAGHAASGFSEMVPHACDDGSGHTSPVARYAANAFGLHDMLGNVWEWVEDCWHSSYKGAPADGSAWLANGRCSQRILRGGSWVSIARFVRVANRSKMNTDIRIYRNGFRVARDVE